MLQGPLGLLVAKFQALIAKFSAYLRGLEKNNDVVALSVKGGRKEVVVFIKTKLALDLRI
jgi:hypothetical protein